MKKSAIFLLMVAAICVLVVTNPSQQAHQRAILRETGQDLGTDLGGEIGGVIAQALADLLGKGLESLDLSLFEYNNYIVFSTMTLGGKTVSLGILGQVILL